MADASQEGKGNPGPKKPTMFQKIVGKVMFRPPKNTREWVLFGSAWGLSSFMSNLQFGVFLFFKSQMVAIGAALKAVLAKLVTLASAGLALVNL